LPKRGAIDSFSGESQHAWAKGSEEDGGVWGGDFEFGTGGQLVADHVRLLSRQQRLKAVNEIASKRKRPIPRESHSILGLVFGSGADAERKAPPKCSLGGHGLLRQADRVSAVKRNHRGAKLFEVRCLCANAC
jgi:hypothetical protein